MGTPIFPSSMNTGNISIVAMVLLYLSGAVAQSQYRPGASAGRPGGSGGFGGSNGGFTGNDAGFNGDAGGAEGSLEETIPGIPGEDYPIFGQVPESSFLCDGQVDGGYYADTEAECQAFHICGSDGNGGLTKYSFLCPNGTLFNQQYFVCDWWFNVDCSLAEEFYSLNDEVAADRLANSPAGASGGQYGGATGGRQGAGSKGRGGSGGRNTGSSDSLGSASSLRGSYAAPSGFGGGSGSQSGFGGSDSTRFEASSGYGAPPGGYEVRRRNSRDIGDITGQKSEHDM